MAINNPPYDISLRHTLNGENSTFGRMDGGQTCIYAAVSADGIVYSGACRLVGVKVLTAGTSITLYDNTSAAGQAVISAEATTSAGAVLTPMGTGVSLTMNNGIYADITGGTYIVGYIPAA